METPDSQLRVTITVDVPRTVSPPVAPPERKAEPEPIPWYPELDERVVVDISRYAYLHLIEAWKMYYKSGEIYKPTHFGQIYVQDSKGVFFNMITGEVRP